MKYIALTICISLLSACNQNDTSSTYVKVYKSDGSVQCGSAGEDLNVMGMELINAGIDVVCSQKGHDGMMRTQVCGADTGNINIYEIYSVNLPDAGAIGFDSVNNLTEYQDQKCE
jgi:transcription elongation factor Elf1